MRKCCKNGQKLGKPNGFARRLLGLAPLLRILRNQLTVLFFLGSAGIAAACEAVPVPSPTPTDTPFLSPTLTPAPTSTPEPLLPGTGPEHASDGRAGYLEVCAVSHGNQAKRYANDQAAPELDVSEHASEHPDPQIHDWIVNSKLGLGRQMPAYGDRLQDAEVHAIIAYLHALWSNDQLRVQQDLGRRWPATPEPTWTQGP